jgi:hypothetical protein
VAIDSAHTFTLTINAVNRWGVLEKSSLRMRDNEGGEVDTLKFMLDDSAVAITITPWQVVEWIADGATYLFGGYVTSVAAAENESGLGRKLTVSCEGYITRCHKVEAISKTYIEQTPGDIVDDLFSEAGIGDFDTTTHVTAGAALDVFAVQTEPLAKSMDRLAEICGYVWRVDGEKNVWFGDASSDQTDFDVSDESNADYLTVYPVIAGTTTIKNTADEVKNKVIVHGGYKISDIQTDTFSGDGAQKFFNLSNTNIERIHAVIVDGSLKRWGQDGWHGNSLTDIFDAGIDVLISYRAGYVYFDVAPGVGTDNVVVKYTVQTKMQWTAEDAGSIAAFGLTFVHNHYDNNLTSDTEAQDVISAILADFADAVEQGTFSVARLGLAAGQEVHCEFPGLGVDDDYTIRSVDTEMSAAIGRLIHRVTFGGRSTTLTKALQQATDRREAYEQGSMAGKEINDSHVYNYDAVGTGTFTAP